jgi:hypothetical protein
MKIYISNLEIFSTKYEVDKTFWTDVLADPENPKIIITILSSIS